jgi:hypothetical protein
MSQNLASVVPDYSDSGGSGGGGVNSVNAGTGITITGPSTDPIINALPASVPRPSATIYVSPSGNDTTANGSISLPFLTIQGALTFRSSLSLTDNVEIYIFSGNYAGPITINTPNTYLTGPHAPYREAKTVVISGNLTVDINALSGQGGCEVSLTNLLFTSTQIVTGSSVDQGLLITITNCNITGWMQHNESTVVGVYNVRYYDCLLFHNGAEALVTSVGPFLQIWRCEMTHSNAVTNPVINLQNGNGGSAAILNLQYTSIRSTTTSATAQPIIRYQNTATSNSNVMLHNSLYFTSSVADTATDKCCIQFNQTGNVNFETMSYNLIDCAGATFIGDNTAPLVIQRRNAGAVNLGVFAGNYADPTAPKVSGFIVKTVGVLAQ